jgi:hypothetical protein
MTKFLGLMVALTAAVGVTLATPASSEAGGFFRWRRSHYAEPSYYSSPVVEGSTTGPTVVTPGYSATYYPTYSSGYYRTSPGYFSGYYRVGNVIINGRRWGDIGVRYTHADLIRW